MKHRAAALATALATVTLLAPAARAQVRHWAGFRGNAHDGVAGAGAHPPIRWNAEENLAWKRELPGPGAASPIVVGEQVIVYCYSGFGNHLDGGGDPKELRHHLLSFDRKTGAPRWETTIPGPLTAKPPRVQLSEHGFASPTPVCDGTTIFAYLGRAGVVALDLKGTKLWQTDLGEPSKDAPEATNRVSQKGKVLPLRWGTAASPVVHGDLLFVNCSEESNSIRALDKRTGKLVWKKESANLEGSATPPMIAGSGDEAVLVINLGGAIWGLEPRTGAVVWDVETEARGGMSPMPVTDGKLLYVFGGSGKSRAVRFSRKFQPSADAAAGSAPKPTERKTVTDAEEEIVVARSPRVVWESENLDIPSPVLFGDRLFLVRTSGHCLCLDAKTGEVLHKGRLEGRTASVYASPVIAGDKLYVVSRKRGTFVYSTDGEFKLIERNELDDDSQFNGSPAIAGDLLFLRSDKFLYCIAERAK